MSDLEGYFVHDYLPDYAKYVDTSTIVFVCLCNRTPITTAVAALKVVWGTILSILVAHHDLDPLVRVEKTTTQLHEQLDCQKLLNFELLIFAAPDVNGLKSCAGRGLVVEFLCAKCGIAVVLHEVILSQDLWVFGCYSLINSPRE